MCVHKRCFENCGHEAAAAVRPAEAKRSLKTAGPDCRKCTVWNGSRTRVVRRDTLHAGERRVSPLSLQERHAKGNSLFSEAAAAILRTVLYTDYIRPEYPKARNTNKRSPDEY
jgi:hypothetical protein